MIMQRLKSLLKKSPTKQITTWQKKELITQETATMLHGVMNVGHMQVRDIMITKSQMCTIAIDTPADDYLSMIVETGHSRFPLIDTQNDKALGIIMAKDVLKHTLTKDIETLDLMEVSRPVKVIPESKKLNLLLREFRLSHKHMAIVINEYGNISGLITIEDVLEQIVGDIIDEFDVSANSAIDKIAKNTYEMSAITPIEVCNQTLGLNLPTADYDTVGGIVMHAFGRMPKRNETIDTEGVEFKVVSCDHRRIKHIEMRLKQV